MKHARLSRYVGLELFKASDDVISMPQQYFYETAGKSGQEVTLHPKVIVEAHTANFGLFSDTFPELGHAGHDGCKILGGLPRDSADLDTRGKPSTIVYERKWNFHNLSHRK